MRGVSANKPPMAASKCRLHITTTIKLKKSKEHLLDSFQVKKFANRKIYANKYPLISSIHSCSVWFLFACFLFGWMEALLMEMLLAVASLVFQWLFILVKHFHHVAPRSSAAVKLQHLQLLRSQDTQQHRNKKQKNNECRRTDRSCTCEITPLSVLPDLQSSNCGLLWQRMFVKKWRWKTTRKRHFKLLGLH